MAGGKVYTYEAGTNTPKVTYTDYSADPMSQNTNPVILDSSGSADIWLVGNYKIDLTDSNDASGKMATDVSWTNRGSGTYA